MPFDGPGMDGLVAIALPGRRLPEVLQPLTDRPGRHRVAKHVNELVHVQHPPVVALDLARGAVFHFFLLGLVAAEQVVIQHDHAAVVLVDVLRVAPVVHAVVGGRVDPPFDPGVQPGHRFGVHEPLEGEVGAEQAEHQLRGEARQDGRHIEHPGADDAVQDALPRGGRHVHDLAGVVRDVLGPEPAHAMGGAVIPVVAQLLDEEGQDDGADVDRDGIETVVPDHREQGGNEQQVHQAAGYVVAHAEREIRQHLARPEWLPLPGVPAASFAAEIQPFEQECTAEDGDHRDQNHLVHGGRATEQGRHGCYDRLKYCFHKGFLVPVTTCFRGGMARILCF